MSNPSSRVFSVVGGQYGSEGKGAVAAAIVERELDRGGDVISVRVGGPNAGHTAYDAQGRKWALRTVPIGAVVDPTCELLIAAGSEIDPEVLHSEVDALEEAGIPVRDRLIIDEQATVITPDHIRQEQESDITARLGSTAKGIGAARAERMWRTAPLAKDGLDDGGYIITNSTDMFLREFAASGQRSIVVEGTQGYGLGLHQGLYPYCTSGNVTATDTLALAGIAPFDPRYGQVTPVVVLRYNPIRVAGNSGPMQGETSWEDLGLEPEKTTVTQKIRRVGEWDWDLAYRAVEANGGRAVSLALTMMDHAFPEIAGAFTPDRLTDDALAWIARVEDALQASIYYVGTGPDSGIFD